jgi:hypothetical protein
VIGYLAWLVWYLDTMHRNIVLLCRHHAGHLETTSKPVSTATVGVSFDLSCCHTLSRNITAIVWYFNNIPICVQRPAQVQDQRACFQSNAVSNGTGTLHFPSPSLEQAGWYTCATHSEGEQSREEKDFLLIVQGMNY